MGINQPDSQWATRNSQTQPEIHSGQHYFELGRIGYQPDQTQLGSTKPNTICINHGHLIFMSGIIYIVVFSYTKFSIQIYVDLDQNFQINIMLLALFPYLYDLIISKSICLGKQLFS